MNTSIVFSDQFHKDRTDRLTALMGVTQPKSSLRQSLGGWLVQVGTRIASDVTLPQNRRAVRA